MFKSLNLSHVYVLQNIQMMAKRDHSHTNQDKFDVFTNPFPSFAYANGYVVAFLSLGTYICSKIIEKYKNILWSLIM